MGKEKSLSQYDRIYMRDKSGETTIVADLFVADTIVATIFDRFSKYTCADPDTILNCFILEIASKTGTHNGLRRNGKFQRAVGYVSLQYRF